MVTYEAKVFSPSVYLRLKTLPFIFPVLLMISYQKINRVYRIE